MATEPTTRETRDTRDSKDTKDTRDTKDRDSRRTAGKDSKDNASRMIGETEEGPKSFVGRVHVRTDEELADQTSGWINPQTGEELPVKQAINEVPVTDESGGQAFAPANEPGHPDVTTSPLEDESAPAP